MSLFDTPEPLQHPCAVLRFGKRISIVFLTLALIAGNSGVCAGWMPTAEARMACCAGDGPCPMHESEPDHGSARVVTQAEADRCCAISDHEDSSPAPSSAPFFVRLAVAVRPVAALVIAPERSPDMWRTSVPIPAAHVPKHLLLSVFLV